MPELTSKRRTHNPEVAGSNPARATRETAGSRAEGRLPGQREPPRLLPNFCPSGWTRRPSSQADGLDESSERRISTNGTHFQPVQIRGDTCKGRLVGLSWKHRRELAAAQPVDRRPKGVPHPLRGGAVVGLVLGERPMAGTSAVLAITNAYVLA